MECEFNLTPIQKELFDKLTGGFDEPKGVVIFCPVPGMGKSRLIEELLKAGYTVGTFEPAKWNGPDVMIYDEARTIGMEDFREAWENLGKLDHVVIDRTGDRIALELKRAREHIQVAAQKIVDSAGHLLNKADKPWVQMNTAHGNGIPGKRKKGR